MQIIGYKQIIEAPSLSHRIIPLISNDGYEIALDSNKYADLSIINIGDTVSLRSFVNGTGFNRSISSSYTMSFQRNNLIDNLIDNDLKIRIPPGSTMEVLTRFIFRERISGTGPFAGSWPIEIRIDGSNVLNLGTVSFSTRRQSGSYGPVGVYYVTFDMALNFILQEYYLPAENLTEKMRAPAA